MSQQQRPRPTQPTTEPIKYSDVFPVSGSLASKPIAPQDAATMQSAENTVLGNTQKGGPAAVMNSAATKNERAGLVSHEQVTDVVATDGVTISQANVAGSRIITEAVGDQVVGEYARPPPVAMTSPASALDRDAITIGEALQATALSAGNKPVDQSDAAAIQVAEMRATGSSEVDATAKLPDDKPATREDAERVIGAELRNDPNMVTYPGGVAESVAAAARLNQSTK
ncbi:Late embryogenesis abundant protein D-34 [Vitis vinifera]|uniref:Late embryogenesis abundant protein D-34 n=1 Tax=Vitis vinifera TaxID=29760 RepID=A0A438F4E6_VITVI|nr:Late embryogenesis abundant protein D-34 [Vitis vinifera]